MTLRMYMPWLPLPCASLCFRMFAYVSLPVEETNLGVLAHLVTPSERGLFKRS